MPFVEPDGPAWPTATQFDADRQVTPLSRLALPLAGAGTPVTVQALPFQVAAAALPVLLAKMRFESMVPTATQRFPATQETPESISLLVPFGQRTVVSVQVLPLHISVRLLRPLGEDMYPTAAQLFALGHDTVVSSPSVVAGSAAAFIRDQVLPFHDSISTALTVLVTTMPVAMQLAADVHETESRPLMMAPGAGGRASVHFMPFHVSARGALVGPPLVFRVNAPTATQALADLHDTPLREVFSPPGAGGFCGAILLPGSSCLRGRSISSSGSGRAAGNIMDVVVVQARVRMLIAGYPELVAVLAAAILGLSARRPLAWLAGHQGINVLLAVLVFATAVTIEPGRAAPRRGGLAPAAGRARRRDHRAPALSWAVSRLVAAGSLRDGVLAVGLAPCEIASVATTAMAAARPPSPQAR